MPGIDEHLEQQRQRLQSFGNFVGGINKPAPAPKGQDATPFKKSTPATRKASIDKGPQSRGRGRVKSAAQRASKRRKQLSQSFSHSGRSRSRPF